MKAMETARKVVEKFGTADVLEIARRSGLKIVRESWHPVTIGEFDRKNMTICVNRRALENVENADLIERKIVAHELGHFFALDLKFSKNDEEIFAREFAEIMTKRRENLCIELEMESLKSF